MSDAIAVSWHAVGPGVQAEKRASELSWFDLRRGAEETGSLLAAFELIPAEDCPAFPLPAHRTIREEMTKTNRVRSSELGASFVISRLFGSKSTRIRGS